MLLLYFREWNHTLHILNIPQLWEIREINFPGEKKPQHHERIYPEGNPRTDPIHEFLCFCRYLEDSLFGTYHYQANDWVVLCFNSYENVRLIC
jgi:hypothetical protein